MLEALFGYVIAAVKSPPSTGRHAHRRGKPNQYRPGSKRKVADGRHRSSRNKK